MKRWFIFTVSLLISTVGFTQQLDSTLLRYEQHFPKEKMHIHFDRASYNKNETVWYKIYLLTGNELSNISKNVYVDWYDETGKIIRKTVAPLMQSTAKGAFDIPADYRGRMVRIKAYTRWMLNDDVAFIYQKDLIINSNKADKNRSVPPPVRTKVEVFPEGGFLIQGISKRVAFKASIQYGTPVFIKGSLVDNANKVLDSLKIAHDGMGFFVLLPKAGETYRLEWVDENGIKGITPVSVDKTSGASLSVSASKEKASVLVERTKDAGQNCQQMNMLVHMNQHIYYKVLVKMDDKLSQTAQLPVAGMPTGILQVSLFTSDWIPVAERIVFINNQLHEFRAIVTTPQVNLNKRGKNIIEVNVPDTLFTNMSVAVTDISVNTPEQNTIYSDFLLSSDIKGKVYNPAYYFSSKADSLTAHLDLVMMTNGWRKYDWEKIKAGVLPQLKYPAETEFMKIKGKVSASSSVLARQPLQLNLLIQSKDSSRDILATTIDKDGSFEVPGESFFYDSVTVYYSLKNNKKPVYIEGLTIEAGLLKESPPAVFPKTDPWLNPGDSLAKLQLDRFIKEQENLQKLAAAGTLKDVTVRSWIKSPLQRLEDRYISGRFMGDGYAFDLTDNKNALAAQDIFAYLQGKVPGLFITRTGQGVKLSWSGTGTLAMDAPSINLYLDENSISSETLQTIPMSSIILVKAYRPPFFASSLGGANGALAVYTRKIEDMKNYDMVMENVVLAGYSRFKEFYSPNYEKPDEFTEPDVRPTLYWNPYVLTDKSNPTARLEFYNNDISKKLQVVVEGINSDGRMMRIVKMLE